MTVLATLSAAVALAAGPAGCLAARLTARRRLDALAVVLVLDGATAMVASGSRTVPSALAAPVHVAVVLLLLGVLLHSWRPRSLAIRVGGALLAVWHVVAIAVPAASTGPAEVVPATLRLLAVVLTLGGILALAGDTLARIDATQDALDEELRLAELHRARLAERDHELRNGLAGLAGAARLSGRDDLTGERLDALVASELRRLDDLLRTERTGAGAARPTAYAIGPVLGGLGALRRASGLHVRVDVEPGLAAVGRSEILAQVIVNLLANAERHAPGSPVRIRAVRRGARTVVVVRDDGPGLRAGREELVFGAGVRDRSRGGRGLGLPTCRRLLLEEEATIAILPTDPARPGCAVRIDLPAPPRAAAPLPDTAGAPRMPPTRDAQAAGPRR